MVNTSQTNHPSSLEAVYQPGFLLTPKAYTQIATLQWYLTLLIVSGIVLTFLSFSVVPTFSMYPTLNRGAYCLGIRHPASFERGDIITFFPEDYKSTLPGPIGALDDIRSGKTVYIKRLVALPGDTVAVHDGSFILNGVPMQEVYLNEQTIEGEFDEYTLQGNEYFVMGDNRNHSLDSRYIGPIRLGQISSKVIWYFSPQILWSEDNIAVF